MKISEHIPLPVEEVVEEILRRQGSPWNNGRINEYDDFPLLEKMFRYMNSGIPEEDYFYRGNLFRIHTSYSTFVTAVDNQHECIIHSSSDGSCRVLPKTDYSDKLVAFSKDKDFTRNCYYKVCKKDTAIMFYCNTGSMCGIDINSFFQKYGYRNELYEEEKEVLFPLNKQYVIKEYKCTPYKFNYYLRGIID